MKKRTEEPMDPKKEEEKKDRRKNKEEKEDGPTVKLGLEVEVEGPKVIKRPPKRGGCVSGSAGVGLAGNAQISIHPALSIEPGQRPLAGNSRTRLHPYVLIAVRDIPKGNKITEKDVGMIEREKSSRAQPIEQVVRGRATRDIRRGEVVKKGMVR